MNGKLLLSALPIILCGCSIGIYGTAPELIAESTPKLAKSEITDRCPKRPSENLQNVPIISIGDGIAQNGIIIAGQDIGYDFNAEAGQKLKYENPDNLCIWVYSPDNEIIDGVNLEQTGIYRIQAAVLKGSKTFELKFNLIDPQETSQKYLSESEEGEKYLSANEPSDSLSKNKPSDSWRESEASYRSLSENEATELVKTWLRLKSQIFGPSYNHKVAAGLATGKRLEKAEKSIKWLRDNQAYYTYQVSRVDRTDNFSVASDKSQIDVTITEGLTYYVKNKVNNNRIATKKYRFMFKLEGKTWKIENIIKL